MDTAQTLLLNQGFEPIKVISWQRAITLLFLGKVEVLEEYGRDIRSVNVVIKVPAVVRLLRAFRRHARPVKFSRVNIYARDNYKCQYCARKASISELTYDHVVPRSQGGLTEWTNIVTCCYLCNRKKGGRTPREAAMTLLAQPTQPNWVPAVAIRISLRSIPDAWRDYLYWTGEPIASLRRPERFGQFSDSARAESRNPGAGEAALRTILGQPFLPLPVTPERERLGSRHVRICFVCLGNICRSPTAEGVMAHLVAEAGLAAAIAIDSAGTGAYHVGELPDPRSRQAARRRGYELTHHARQFTRVDLDRFDLVIAMDRHNLRHLRLMAERREGPGIHLLRSFDPTAPAEAEVPDPWAGGEDGFEEVLDQCERACAGLLAYVRERLP